MDMEQQAAPWMPKQIAGYGPWVEHRSDNMPISGGASVVTLLRLDIEYRITPEDHACKAHQMRWSQLGGDGDIIAYCVKLEAAQPASEVYSNGNFGAWLKPATWTDDTDPDHDGSDTFADDIQRANDIADAHQAKRMIEADKREPSARELAHEQSKASGDTASPVAAVQGGLLVVHPADHRLGAWK